MSLGTGTTLILVFLSIYQLLPLAFAIAEMNLTIVVNEEGSPWLEPRGFHRWTLAHDGGKRYGLLTTNLSEIFNSVLKGARFLPITRCVQLTFYRLVHYFDVRRPQGIHAQSNGERYAPHVVAKQEALKLKASAHSVRSFNWERGIFEVITHRGRNVQVVNLEKETCTRGKWEAYKYPCSHVLSACANLSLNSWQYVHKCYSIREYCATWASEFFPLPHEAYWPQPSFVGELLPNSNLKRVKAGHPRSTRIHNGMDIKEREKNNLCGICKKSGHNRKKCPSRPTRMGVDV
ncbi:DNA-binding WRKY transcription factor [Tanacetum coccineum]